MPPTPTPPPLMGTPYQLSCRVPLHNLLRRCFGQDINGSMLPADGVQPEWRCNTSSIQISLLFSMLDFD